MRSAYTAPCVNRGNWRKNPTPTLRTKTPWSENGRNHAEKLLHRAFSSGSASDIIFQLCKTICVALLLLTTCKKYTSNFDIKVLAITIEIRTELWFLSFIVLVCWLQVPVKCHSQVLYKGFIHSIFTLYGV